MTTEGPQAEPDLFVMAAVIDLARRLDVGATIGADAADTPVLAPISERHISLNDLDLAIADGLEALVAVCSRPADRLGIEHVLVRSDEARRVPVEGLVRLASRTEEWQGRDAAGEVIPARLLTVRFNEEYDFFENRMAAQMVDRLRRYLAGRLRDLGTLERHAAGLERYEQALGGAQSHWKLRRLAMLLGEAAADTAVHAATISAACDRLRSLQSALNRLRGVPLYRRANRRASIPFRLPRTNLLTRDLRYRRTAALWEAWALDESGTTAWHREARADFATAYGSFTAAATTRALEILNLDAVCPDRTIAADGPLVEIRSEGVAVANVVAVPFDLAADPAVAERFATVRSIPTVLAYPGLLSGRERLAPVQRAAAHWTGPSKPGSALTGIVPINPLEIESIERLARALRWALWAPFLTDSYPQRIDRPPWWRPQPNLWAESGPGSLRLLSLPSGPEKAALAAEIDRADAARPRRRGEHHQPDAAAVIAALDRAEAMLRRVATCPICRSDSAVRFEPRAQGTFHCSCGDCDGQWGLRWCGACAQRFPVLWAHGATLAPIGNEDALDAAFGSDIAALPCPETSDWTRFQCPWCGVCQAAPDCGGSHGGAPRAASSLV